MKPCQPCGSCHACVAFHGVVPISANAQYHRRQLQSLSGLQHPCIAPTRALRRASRVNGNSKCPKSSSTVTECPSFVRVKAASDTMPSDLTPAQMHGFAGLGAQRTLDFLAAWDQLALRLPPQAGMGKAAELILNALKLEVSHLPAQTDPLEASAAASKALAIAKQLADLSGQGFPLDAESIAAGILVDAVAAQRLSLDLVDHRLGSAVAILTEDVIKVRRLPTRVDLYDDVASSALRELALTFYDTRAIVVELVARLVGMGTLLGTPLYARQLAALEALQIYAPLGHGLGLRALCAQLEDRCFQELFPESYAETAAWLRREVNAHGDSLARCEQQLQAAVEQDPEFQVLAAGCQVAGRTKSLFSTMKKLLRLDSIDAGGRAPQEVHDILASRCIVTPHPDLPAPQAEEFATQACYVVARVATSLFDETAARRKDYIAQPKDNGYQSLHCTIKLPAVTVECEGGDAPGDPDRGAEECVLQQGPTCELQIRTQRMHELAESGDAAHAAYKGGLDALQANKLQSWTLTLRALPPAALVDEHHPPEWSNHAAAAEQLFSHLDRDGDGYISVEEVGVLLEELGVDAGVGQEQDPRQSHGADAGAVQGAGQQLQGADAGAGQQLLAALANKQQSGVTFAEFLQFNSQASLLGALPKVDTETAQTLLSPSHNESTISLDLDDLPNPPELMRPPRPRTPPPSTSQEQRASPRASQSLDWDDLSPQKSSSSKSGNGAQSQRQTLAGSWDNLQPLFRPPPRVEPPKEPQQPPNEAAAADMMFSAIQSKRYKHEKGTSYKDATFALVPVDRKVGWRLHCDDAVTVAQPIHLPQHGPLLLGGGDPRQGNCDLVLESAVEAGPGVHARLEIHFNGRKPCCLVTCLKPYGTTFVNKVKLPRMVDTEVYLGDILSFGELTMAFQLVPVLVPDRQQSALDNALHCAKPHATKQRVPKKYEVVAEFVRQMSRDMQFSQARALMTSHLVKDPVNSEGWAQLANMERRMASSNMKDASIPAARCFYRAAAELIQIKLKANASPNGEAERGSQQHQQLIRAVTSFIRVMSSWAQMEFDLRNDTSARRLYRRALDAVPEDPPLQGLELIQPIKLLFKWAHQEFKGDNLFQARELLQGLLQLEPTSTRGLGMLGTLEWKAGKRKLARQYLVAGIKADPSHVANLHTLARLELEEGHLQEARELFARGQQLEPNNAYVLQSWALAEAAEGNTELARDMLQKATLVQPRSVPCWHAWAALEMTNGNTDKARELYLKALELDPRETFTQSALGALERKCGNYNEALAYLNRALELTPRHPAACVEKAIVLRKQGKTAQADTLTETALKEKTNVAYKRGTREKHANEFVRSSEAEQEERRQRQQKEAQGQARKTAATQKGKKAHINRMRRKRKQKQKQEAKAQQEAAAAALAQAEGPVERVVNTEMQ
ncbi:hypothetical protein WJX82_005847 [Trebouxia sp. C0006]